MSEPDLADLQAAVTHHASSRDPVEERRKLGVRTMQRWATFARSLCILATLIGLLSIGIGAVLSQPVWIMRGTAYAAAFALLYFWSRRSVELPVLIAACVYAMALLSPAEFRLRLLSGSIALLATQWVLIAVSLYGLWQYRQARRSASTVSQT